MNPNLIVVDSFTSVSHIVIEIDFASRYSGGS